MIIINVINWLVTVFQGFTFNFSFDSSVISTFVEIIDLIAWVLPLKPVITIISITLVLFWFRLFVSVFKTIMEILPFV